MEGKDPPSVQATTRRDPPSTGYIDVFLSIGTSTFPHMDLFENIHFTGQCHVLIVGCRMEPHVCNFCVGRLWRRLTTAGRIQDAINPHARSRWHRVIACSTIPKLFNVFCLQSSSSPYRTRRGRGASDRKSEVD